MRKRGGQRERETEDVKVNRSHYIKCDQTSVVGLGGHVYVKGCCGDTVVTYVDFFGDLS